VSEHGEVELQNALDQLERAGLIFRRGRAPNAIYSFKHALVRDAAYAGLLMSKRRRLHSGIARVLKEKFGDREPELLAFHFTEGGELAEAVSYWLVAGQRAAERSANVEAVAHLRHGLKLIESLPETAQTAQLELAFQSALGLPLIATKGYAAIETGAAYDRARKLCDRIGNSSQLFPIMYGQGVISMVHGDYRKGQRIFEEFLSSAIKQGGDGLILVARRMLGLSHFLRGDLIEARNFIEHAALVETGMGAEMPFLLALLAEAHGRHGEPAAGLSVLDEALAAIQNVDEFWWVADIHRLRGRLLLSLDANHAAAEGHYRKAIDLAERQGAKWLELRAATDFARLLHAQGRHDETRAWLAPVYGRFTEGFELLDLREAKAMLDQLEASSSLSADDPEFR
jgi:predicted ATPase